MVCLFACLALGWSSTYVSTRDLPSNSWGEPTCGLEIQFVKINSSQVVGGTSAAISRLVVKWVH